MRLVKARKLFLLFLFSSFSRAVQASDLLAVLIQVEGTVTITERFSRGAIGPTTRPRIRRARLLQVVGFGDGLRIPQGASVGLVCSTDRWVLLLSSKAERRLDNSLCSVGQPLMPGTYRRLAPKAGRLRSMQGAMVLERETRRPEDEDVTIPILLKPRNTAVLEGRPIIQWTRVEGATDYLIKMTGDVSFQLRFGEGAVSCDQSLDWGGSVVQVCSVPYPQAQPELAPGSVVYLRVAARQGFASPWREQSSSSRVHRLPVERATELHAQLAALAAFPGGEVARRLLAADFFASEGLSADALAAYGEAIAFQGLPEIYVTRGDIYLEIGLLAPATRSYHSALSFAGRPFVVEAATQLGLGQIEYIRRNFELALGHFQRSRDLYTKQGMAQEASTADRAAAKARTKIQ